MKQPMRKHLILLAGLTLFFCWLFVFRLGMFGSKVDWISQHSVLPDYFRQLFYQTGSLFPDFAPHIGGGQNIYNFSYYGLYSPVILISYLLPFAEMGNYIIAASILGLAASVMLLYYWLSSKFPPTLSLLTSCMFLLASPMIYQSYNQLMFINYMPFLIMALCGVDRYFSDRKCGLLFSGIFLMILTSFFFSIGGMLAVVFYGISVYLRQNQAFSIRHFLKEGVLFLRPFISAVVLSSFFLIPTFFALTSGRVTGNHTLTLKMFLIPDMPVMRLLYSPYGLGLTAASMIVLMSGCLSARIQERFLSISLLLIFTVPLFGYLLNGGLYAKDKAFLPFLPLICYLTALFIQHFSDMQMPVWKYIVCYGLTILLLWICRYQEHYYRYWHMIMLDALIMFLFFFICRKWNCKYLFFIPILGFLCIFQLTLHKEAGKILDPDFYNSISDKHAIASKSSEHTAFRTERYGSVSENAADLNRIHTPDQYVSSIYSSVYNQEYQKFRTDTFLVEQPFRNCLMQSVSGNPLFQKFMGVKYTVQNKETAENHEAAPLGYATDHLISEQAYSTLPFPYNQTALMHAAVVSPEKYTEDMSRYISKDNVRRLPFTLPVSQTEKKISFGTDNGVYIINSKKKLSFTIPLPKNVVSGELLFLKFHVKNLRPQKDVAVTFENERNKLSASNHEYYNNNLDFTFVTQIRPRQNTVTITFGKGHYEIQDIEFYAGADEALKSTGLYQNPLIIAHNDTKGDQLTGSLFADQNGYFISSIPYDEGFTVLLDGKPVEYEKVNTAFVGFPVAKGAHHIRIVYHAKGAFAGRIISLLGLLILVFFGSYKALKLHRKNVHPE